MYTLGATLIFGTTSIVLKDSRTELLIICIIQTKTGQNDVVFLFSNKLKFCNEIEIRSFVRRAIIHVHVYVQVHICA